MATSPEEFIEQRRTMELAGKSLQTILQKLDKIADEIPAKIMKIDIAKNPTEAVRAQELYNVLKQDIPRIISKIMNSDTELTERWSFWQWLKKQL